MFSGQYFPSMYTHIIWCLCVSYSQRKCEKGCKGTLKCAQLEEVGGDESDLAVHGGRAVPSMTKCMNI